MLHRYLLAGLLLLLAAPSGVRAQGLIFPGPRRPLPPPAPPLQPLTVKSQKVTMQVQSGALKVEVEQVFQNPNSVQMEGTYLFPLPEGATVSSFRLTIDKEPVEGKLLSVDDARRIYESYVRRNVDPAILEYVGRNAFQARVFPIPAHGERRIFLTYSQALEFSNGIYKAVYPLSSERLTGQTAGDLVVDCTIKSAQPIKTVYSPTHEIQVKRENDHQARATFEGRDVRANRDFVLYYTTSEKAFGLNALAHRRVGEDGYLMLMLAPKREAAASEILPKDVVVVFDTSGSMSGAKIDQARKALLTILGALHDKDRFNIVRFSSDVTNFRPGVVAASKENRDAARAFVDDFKAIGGTAIDDALQAALASFPPQEERKGRAPFLIFMTDGLPTIGVTDIEKILQSAGKAAPADLRLFAFGVGADVNTLLLDRLAMGNRGSADYVSLEEDLETRIGTFYAKIANPVLANVRLELEGATLREPYPGRIPDLFAGGQLLVLGRYKEQGKARVILTGDLNGKPQRYTYELALPERELGQEFIPRLWAGRRIGFLLEEIRLKGENKELKDEVIRLSKDHGIVTPYTSYLVEEPNLPRPGLERRALGIDPHMEGLGAAPGVGGFGRENFGLKGDAGLRGGAAPPSAARPAVPQSAPRAGASKDGYAEAGKKLKVPAGTPGPQGPRNVPTPGTSAAESQEAQDATTRFYSLYRQQARQQQDGFDRSTGWNAVEASRRLQQLKSKEQADVEVEVNRTVEGRRFQWQQQRWQDESVAQGKPKVVAIKYGSDAYFKLIAARQDWARFASLGKQVTFRTGKTTVVAIGEKGAEKLSDSQVQALSK